MGSREFRRKSSRYGHARGRDEFRREPAIAGTELAGPGWIILGECAKIGSVFQFESAAEHAIAGKELAGPGWIILGECFKTGSVFQFQSASVCDTSFEKLVWPA
jgi:hypothetical protein